MIESKIDNVPNATDDESEDDEEMVVIQTTNVVEECTEKKNQKWDPLRAMKTFIRRKVGHTT